MSHIFTHPKLLRVRAAACVLALAAFGAGFECYANAILAESDRDTEPSAFPALLPATAIEASLPGLTNLDPIGLSPPPGNVVKQLLDFGEFDEGIFVRKRRAGPVSGPGGKKADTNPTMWDGGGVTPAFRRFVNVDPDQALAVGMERDRQRRERERDMNIADSDIVWAAEDEIKGAILNAVGEGVHALSLAGIADVSLTLSGERRTFSVNGVEVLSLLRYDADRAKEPLPAQPPLSSGSSNAYAQRDSSIRYGQEVPKLNIVAVVREFVTDPIAILVGLDYWSYGKYRNGSQIAQGGSSIARRLAGSHAQQSQPSSRPASHAGLHPTRAGTMTQVPASADIHTA